jgi:hypothetical protein
LPKPANAAPNLFSVSAVLERDSFGAPLPTDAMSCASFRLATGSGTSALENRGS